MDRKIIYKTKNWASKGHTRDFVATIGGIETDGKLTVALVDNGERWRGKLQIGEVEICLIKGRKIEAQRAIARRLRRFVQNKNQLMELNQ